MFTVLARAEKDVNGPEADSRKRRPDENFRVGKIQPLATTEDNAYC